MILYENLFTAHGIRSATKFDIKSYHSIIRETEKPVGNLEKLEFKAETKVSFCRQKV